MHPDRSDKENILITGVSIRGTRHKKGGEPCQDAWTSYQIHDKGWIVAAADGLSSASHSEEGAKIAIDTAGETLVSILKDCQDISDRGKQIQDAMRRARDAVVSRAADYREKPASYASTLIVAVYDQGRVTIGHIGDGIAVGVKEGETIILSLPGQCEYANETACLVQDDWMDHLRIADYTNIEAFLIATDGCQSALATRSGGRYFPHDPFILPLVSFIRRRLTAGIDPQPDIAALLMSARMEQLSDDDKTLIVLCDGETVPS